MQYSIAKEKVLSELYVRNMTSNKIYNFCLSEIFNNDVEKTDNFMLSKYMGYTLTDLYVIKKKINQANRKNWLTENQRRGLQPLTVFDSL